MSRYWSENPARNNLIDASLVKKSRFTEQQILGTLRDSEARAKTAAVCRKHGVSPVALSK